jgi:hypothetical protein
VQSVEISGPTTAVSGTAVTLNAVYTPPNASGASLLWDNGATGSSTSYTWISEGEKTVVVTATAACGDPVTDVYTVAVTSVCTPVQSVEISGPTTAVSGTAVTLNAAYTPTNATGVSLLWDNGETGSSASYTWISEGEKTVVVTATAACGDPVTDTYTITVTVGEVNYSIYLPLTLKNH